MKEEVGKQGWKGGLRTTPKPLSVCRDCGQSSQRGECGEWNGRMCKQYRQAVDSCSQLSSLSLPLDLSHRSDEEKHLE